MWSWYEEFDWWEEFIKPALEGMVLGARSVAFVLIVGLVVIVAWRAVG